jgi:CDP-diacylglycerol---serine O-phosphatidyltransferase
MDMTPEPVDERKGMRRVVVVIPSAFTLGNLFFGFWAIVSAYRGNYMWAAWFIMFAGVLDGLDGRVARASNTGSRFGAELDSLVDVSSFGMAPALIVYFLELSGAGRFAWVICFVYVMAAAVRLARFNVIAAQGGRHSNWFTGLPSPAAGMTLAVYFPFTQTEWYHTTIAPLNLEHQGLVFLIVLLSVLMVSNVKYPRFPAAGFRNASQLFGLSLYLIILAGGIFIPQYFLFPVGLTYIAYGLLRAMVHNLTDRNDEHHDGDSASMTLVTPAQRGRRTDRRTGSSE